MNEAYGEFIVGVITLSLIVILLVCVVSYLKIYRRKYDYLVIKECLNEKNISLITDEEDLELLKELEEKFLWYAKSWWVNLTPLYMKRYKKVKKIIDKYNLDIELLKKL